MKIYLFAFLIFFPLALKAQKPSILIEGGFNATMVRATKKINPDSAGYDSPGIRGFLGIGIKKKLTTRSGLYFFTQVESRVAGGGNTVGSDTTTVLYRINNTYLNLGAMYYFSFSRVIDLGIGFSNHFLLNSRSIIEQPFYIDIPDNNYHFLTYGYGSYKNYNYKFYTVSIPLQIVINLKKKVSLFSTLDIPLMNRLKNFNSEYVEREFTVQVGARLRVFKF